MSTARAITQLVKSHSRFKLKLSVLEEEKAAAIEAVNSRYAEKEKDLKAMFLETEKALEALNINAGKLAELEKQITD